MPRTHRTTPARTLAAAALCLATWAAQAQPSELDSDARFKASLEAVRQQLLPPRHSAGAPRGEPTLQALLARLERVNNIDQLCQQGLGSQHLCSTRIAQIDEGLGASVGNPLLHALDLSPLQEGLGTAVRAALRQPQNLSQAPTKAKLTLTDLQAYTGQTNTQKPNPRWLLRGLLGQLPAMAVSGEWRGFKSAEQASMAGELLADFADHLMDTLAGPLARCAPDQLNTLGGDRAWYATPEAVAVSGCLGRVLGASKTTELLNKVGLVLQLPVQWMAQDLFHTDNREFFEGMALVGRVMQAARVTTMVGEKTGFTYLDLALPFRVQDTHCEPANSNCAFLVDSLDDEARCTLGGQPISWSDCREVARKINSTVGTANRVYEAWALGFDILNALQGKPTQTKDVQEFMAIANTVSENFARIAQEPQSAMVIHLRKISPSGAGRDAAVWVVNAFTLRQ